MNAATLADENISRFGEYAAFHYEGHDILNTEQEEFSARLAAVLAGRHVRAGDRVLVMAPNSPETLACFNAAWKLGAAIVPVAHQLTPREAAYVVRHSRCRVALTVPGRAAVLAESAPPELLVFGPHEVAGAVDILPELASAERVVGVADCEPDDMAMLLYTSGTTAQPKGVMITHRNLFASCESASLLYPNMERYPFLQLLPLHHVFGILMFHVALVWGMKSVIVPAFDPGKVLRAIQDCRPGRTAVVPAMLVYLMQAPERSAFDTSSLRVVLSGGGPLPEEVRARFAALFGCEVNQGYGLSETMSVGSAYADGEPYRAGSSGRPMPLMNIRIVDPNDGRPLAAGETGEIAVSGPAVSPGYWNDPLATAEAFRDGWFLTGDIGRQDTDGYVYISERKKDLIIKGGENISPREIEEVLHAHPAIAEAAVIGVPDARFGENICAIVALKPGHAITDDEILAFAAERLMKFKVPAQVLFTAALPRNLAGKVLKRVLRQQLAHAAPAA